MPLFQDTIYGDNNIINENNIQIKGINDINVLQKKINTLTYKNKTLINQNKELHNKLSKLTINYETINRKYNELKDDRLKYNII